MDEPAIRATPPEPPGSGRSLPTRLYLVRHGQSTWNDEGRIQGQLDPPLSELGRRQAELVGERFRSREFAGFYSSDLARARETAEAIGRAGGRRPTLRADLREIALGDWEGLTRDQIVAAHPEEWARWSQEPSWDIPPGGEGAAPFQRRVLAALDAVARAHPEGDVLVVTHGGVIQVALAAAVGSGTTGLFPFLIDNTSVTVLLRGHRRTAVAGVNDTSHLDAAVAPGRALGLRTPV